MENCNFYLVIKQGRKAPLETGVIFTQTAEMLDYLEVNCCDDYVVYDCVGHKTLVAHKELL